MRMLNQDYKGQQIWFEEDGELWKSGNLFSKSLADLKKQIDKALKARFKRTEGYAHGWGKIRACTATSVSADRQYVFVTWEDGEREKILVKNFYPKTPEIEEIFEEIILNLEVIESLQKDNKELENKAVWVKFWND